MQNDPHWYKIKLEKFHLICSAVMKFLRKVFQEAESPPPGEIGLKDGIQLNKSVILRFSELSLVLSEIFQAI